jgi:hypothetical protein
MHNLPASLICKVATHYKGRMIACVVQHLRSNVMVHSCLCPHLLAATGCCSVRSRSRSGVLRLEAAADCGSEAAAELPLLLVALGLQLLLLLLCLLRGGRAAAGLKPPCTAVPDPAAPHGLLLLLLPASCCRATSSAWPPADS